jgi:hypothetical protein
VRWSERKGREASVCPCSAQPLLSKRCKGSSKKYVPSELMRGQHRYISDIV